MTKACFKRNFEVDDVELIFQLGRESLELMENKRIYASYTLFWSLSYLKIEIISDMH